MATQHDAISPERHPPTSYLKLAAPELHDFSDLRKTDGQPNHMLRWMVTIGAVFVAGHLVFSPAGMAPRIQLSTSAASSTISL
jgi:hypothetical protein